MSKGHSRFGLAGSEKTSAETQADAQSFIFLPADGSRRPVKWGLS